MKKRLISISVLMALSSNQLIADQISGGPRVNLHSGEVFIPCVNVDDPGGEYDGRYFDVKLVQRADSFDFIFGEEEQEGVCIKLIEASLNADDDTSDVNGNLGSNGLLNSPPGTPAAPGWIGLIGIDYQPNHYSAGSIFNGHNVFYVGMDSTNTPVTNIYAELTQLKAAGFTIARSYQTDPYSWIDLIMQASALGLSVIYEADIPQGGNQTSTTAAIQVLINVIEAVGVSTFQNTVSLVLAGHENYSNTNINYLASAIRQIQVTLAAKQLSSVPVGTALVSGNLVTPGNPADMQKLISASSAQAPLGFDPYPFQWGVTPAGQAASNATLDNSIASNYTKVKQQSFYQAPKPILMAETGWATDGTGQWAQYFCYLNNTPCEPSVANAADYLQDLYSFVRTASNTSSALVFEAYDEPAKSPAHPDNAENYYGIFDSNCSLKDLNTQLLPDTGFDPGKNPGCQGYTEGSTFSITGTQPGNAVNQPSFLVEIKQTNPATSDDASMDVTIRQSTGPTKTSIPGHIFYCSMEPMSRSPG
ncbi:hypothetical protein AU255_17805 [Methyloprofundus sedimenti]|uniref:Endo-1,3-beta-glucanase btgC n=1 Tax=Methyloprofundus sedimenti TaxID=1420851 RepID=A0A1V8M183_9GAMM|nr:hypothetical protein [Methyloprofundus sedimenti]OQK15327.1 hypothetical protein AU255_17805 [Methyloprofundus sedimenti]